MLLGEEPKKSICTVRKEEEEKIRKKNSSLVSNTFDLAE